MKTSLFEKIAETTAIVCILACALIMFPFILLGGVLWEVFSYVHRKLFK